MSDVLLPGTLDSAISTLDPALRVSYYRDDREASALQACRGWAAADRIVELTARCQQLSVYGQLMMGIRFLDLQLTYDAYSEEVYCSRTFLGAPFRTVASEVARFLGEPYHGGEFVVVRVGLDPATRHLMHPSRARSILSRGDDIAPFFERVFAPGKNGRGAPLRNSTVSDVRGKVVLLCDEDAGECLPGGWYPAEDALLYSINSEQDVEASLGRQLRDLPEALFEASPEAGRPFVLLAATIYSDSVALLLTKRTLAAACLVFLIVATIQRSRRARNAAILFLGALAAVSVTYPVSSASREANAVRFQRRVSSLLRSGRFPRGVNIVATDFPAHDFAVAVIERNAHLRVPASRSST